MTDTTTQDRELLELAAKAVGIDLQTQPMFGGDAEPGFYDPRATWYWWNPLTDDADALRLAVKLKITPHIDGNLTDAESAAWFATEPHYDDPYAATRRAIVRAAAAIGRQLP